MENKTKNTIKCGNIRQHSSDFKIHWQQYKFFFIYRYDEQKNIFHLKTKNEIVSVILQQSNNLIHLNSLQIHEQVLSSIRCLKNAHGCADTQILFGTSILSGHMFS